MERLVNGHYPSNFSATLPHIFNLTSKMIVQEPSERPSALEVRELFNQTEDKSKFVPICEE